MSAERFGEWSYSGAPQMGAPQMGAPQTYTSRENIPWYENKWVWRGGLIFLIVLSIFLIANQRGKSSTSVNNSDTSMNSSVSISQAKVVTAPSGPTSVPASVPLASVNATTPSPPTAPGPPTAPLFPPQSNLVANQSGIYHKKNINDPTVYELSTSKAVADALKADIVNPSGLLPTQNVRPIEQQQSGVAPEFHHSKFEKYHEYTPITKGDLGAGCPVCPTVCGEKPQSKPTGRIGVQNPISWNADTSMQTMQSGSHYGGVHSAQYR